MRAGAGRTPAGPAPEVRALLKFGRGGWPLREVGGAIQPFRFVREWDERFKGALRANLCRRGLTILCFAADTSVDAGRQHYICQRLMKLHREGDGWAPLPVGVPMER